MDNMQMQIVEEIMRRMREAGGEVAYDENTGLVSINGLLTASVFIARCLWTPAGNPRWDVRINRAADITVVVRLKGSGLRVMDYYLFPTIAMPKDKFRLTERNDIHFNTYRTENLDFLISLARQVKIGAA